MSEPFYTLTNSRIQGMGLFASRRIRKGTRIIEYTGERIDQDEASRRYDDDAMDRHHTFLFGIDDDTVIDAAVGGNDARFINHSCNPNCEAVMEDDRIFIYALRKIDAGEELTYDYQLERGDESPDWHPSTNEVSHESSPTCPRAAGRVGVQRAGAACRRQD
jgi:SET domain-containing protein